MKICSKCKAEKEDSCFSKRGSPRTGLRPSCKKCESKHKKDYRSNSKIKKMESEYGIIYRLTNIYKNKKKRLEAKRKRRVKKENHLMVQELKHNPCCDCGRSFLYYCMDFDHKDPTKKRYNINAMIGKGYEIILNEISKCDLVCANCHRLREFNKSKNRTRFYESPRYRSIHDRVLELRRFKNKPCKDCHEKFHFSQMDFDHLSGKLDNVSRLIMSPKFFNEVLKCEVVCANCHRQRSFSRMVG